MRDVLASLAAVGIAFVGFAAGWVERGVVERSRRPKGRTLYR